MAKPVAFPPNPSPFVPPPPGKPTQQPGTPGPTSAVPSGLAGVPPSQPTNNQYHAQLDDSVHPSVRLAIYNLEQMVYDAKAGIATMQQQQLGGALATATVSGGGAVNGVTMTCGGYYVRIPIVSFIGGGGTGATGTAIMTGNKVTGVTITAGGSGYTSAPTVVFTL